MKDSAYAAGRYLEVQVATAPRERLVLMCFDGLLRFLHRAEQALEKGELQEAHGSILRSQAIVAELRGSLRMEMGEIPERLAGIYDFLHQHLVQANIHKDRRRVEETIRIVTELRAAWEAVCQRVPQPAAGGMA